MTMIDFLLQGLDLKDEPRRGWVLRGIEDPEMVASHSWGVAVLTMVYATEADVDEHKTLKMAVIHDIAEAKTGDMAIGEVHQEVTDDERNRLEHAAMEEFTETADIGEIHSLWKEFEAQESPEAKFVGDMDILDMCLQALKYEQEGRYDPDDLDEKHTRLDGFFETADENLETERGRELFEEIRPRYEAAKREE